MLHKNSVSEQLLGILKVLMNTPEFKDLYLVGGTSLALQIGHRMSIDIDMFGKIELMRWKLFFSFKNRHNYLVK
ncbi:MAG: nucleotidyl transferase AbiEii/AbiGii toxin family protein [Sphingobacteriaceae bacterium]|nr:nucleotidyl transferase AbiEii/AbiGii toxin family protein [Sphingobacteriaceae bacterium]